MTTRGPGDVDIEVELLRALLDMAPNGIVAVDSDGRIVFANAGAEKLFRSGTDELVGERFQTFVPGAAPAVGVIGPPGGSEVLGRRKDGSEFPARISCASIEVDGRPLTAVAIHAADGDIESRKPGEPDVNQVQRLAGTLPLWGGVGHDFDNLLTVILDRATFLRDQLTADRRDHVRGDVDEILLAARRACVLTRELANLAQADDLLNR
jgi:hypothetical protein